MYGEDHIDFDRLREHFELLAEALTTKGKDEPDTLMPLHAPDWFWEAWEARELEWLGWENTFAQIRALPDCADYQYPEEEWADD